jgi:phospholipid N-methyltransferase
MKREASPGKSRKKTPDWLLFMSKFFRQGVAISSLVPSSAFLARGLIRDIDWARCGCVVELGAGTGPVTAEILALAPSTCRVVIVERDADFCARLRERFPGADIVQADAVDLERLLEERGLDKVDHFLCGLPLPSFPREAKERVLGAVFARLKEGGTFRALTHMPYVYYRMYRRYFSKVRFTFVFRNLPPAGFYTCRGPRPIRP